MTHVISIQSQVVHGHVGNSAAVFPMQAAGLDVAAVPTVLLSNHPHYPTVRGRTMPADLVADLLCGVEERGLVDHAAVVVTGYLGSVETGLVVADFIARAKARNHRMTHVCDPVIGDDDLGVFVEAGLIAVFRDVLVPMADVITPNRYELSLLSGCEIHVAAAVTDAANLLRARGIGAVVATGCRLDDTPQGTVETLTCTADSASRCGVPLLPIRPCGTGDLFTALLVTRLIAGDNAHAAAAGATRAVFAVLERTCAAGSSEMRIVGHTFEPRLGD
ncbi:pyridoxal kinase [Sphingomonas floccifaciens]|uniref:pyridoxal kinase n=1 Tax=Sphingomonas floccifaciens TaxID=1844115 RepID=A0ABW4NBM9_9SPHN